MKKILLFLFVAGIILPRTLHAQEQPDGSSSFDFVNVTIDDFTIKLPHNCSPSKELSQPEEGLYTWKTPDNSFFLTYGYYAYDNDYSQWEGLIEEAASIDMELTGQGDIMDMSLGGGNFLSFSVFPTMALGVSKFYPQSKTGLFIMVLVPNATDNGNTVFEVITSLRYK